MNDAKIIKALECFAINKDFDESQCIGCVFEHKFCTANMSEDIAKLTLNLIKRQQAEIEELKLENRVLSQNRITMPERLEIVNNAKDKAIREFAEKLKATFPDRQNSRCTLDDCYTLDIIDNLVKQMTVRIDKNESEEK